MRQLCGFGLQGLRAAVLAVLLLPGTSGAREFLPPQAWLESVKALEPFIPYRLGMVACEAGTDCSPCGQPAQEYLADARAALRDANLFDRAAPTRMIVGVQIKQATTGYDERRVGTCNAAITYRFRDGERTVYEHTMNISALTDAFTDATVKSVLTASVKMLVLKMRREQGDAAFLARADALEKPVSRDLMNHSRSIGGMMTQGFVSTVEGTVEVVKGVGEVGVAMVEVAASPEFQAAVQQSLAEQQAERDRQEMMLRDIQRQADEQRRAEEARAEEMQRASVASSSAPVTTSSIASTPQFGNASDSAQPSQADFEQARQEEEARRRAAEEERERRRKAEEERLEMERKAKEAERVRLAEERKRQEELARQQRQRDLENYLAAEARAIRMRAITCDGKYQATGIAPSVKPQLANCISVHYEARCPGTPRGQGIHDRINNYVGGASCYGETRELPGRLNCPVDSVIVDVTQVSLCH